MNKRAVAVYKIKVLLLTTLLVSTNATPQERKKLSHESMRALIIRGAPVLASVAELFDNGLIAFAADEQIYVMNSDGSGVRRITDVAPGVINRYPALSPDASRIAFIRDDGLGDYELCLIGVDRKDWQCITRSVSPLGEPAWSPDGSQIAYIRGYDSTLEGYASITNCSPEIYVINITSGEEANLTQGDGGTDPAWSPDGTQIAFSSFRDGNYEIYTAALDGSQIQRRTYSSWAEAEPSWSPDGSQIAYVAHLIQGDRECGFMPTGGRNGGGANEARSSVYLMNTDDNKPTPLAGTVGAIELSWSPSGAWLALSLKVKGNTQIYVTDAWGRNLTNLTSDPTIKSSPSWVRHQTLSK